MKKVAYLTIDDSPSKDMKKKLDTLVSNGIPAIWFCIGRFLQKKEKYAVHAIQSGHILGNHSYSHPRFSFLPLKKCFEEIQKTDKIINDIYRKAQIERPAKFFRFPYGDKGDFKRYTLSQSYIEEGRRRKEKLQALLKSLGYTRPTFKDVTYKYLQKTCLSEDVDWDFTYDVMEWAMCTKGMPSRISSLEKVLKRIDENFPEERKGLKHSSSVEIIVIHDHHQTTYMFKPIIEKLLSKNLIFKLPTQQDELLLLT